MRKLISFLHISIDGFAAGPNGEMDWIKVDDEIFDFVKTFTDQTDTALYGRKTWKMMDAYWPTAADKPNPSRHDVEHSQWYNSVEKFALSNTMHGQVVHNTTFLGGDVVVQINQLKQRAGRDIIIFGSPSVARSLTGENVIDEYWLFVNPVILGQGISVFSSREHSIELDRKAVRLFSCGVTAMNFAVKG